MPHVDIKYFPRDLSQEQKQALANEVCEVLKKYLQSKDSALSVALTEVAPENWKAEVYDPVIKPELDNLVKKPGYTM